MRKFFTLALATLLSAGVWADTAVLSWQMGENGADATAANSITGAAGCAAEGWTITISGDSTKEWRAGNGKIILNGDSVMTLKNSNGAQNTITLPEGLYASKIEFYAVTNDSTAKGVLTEVDGVACKDSVESLKDYDHPTYIAKELETPTGKFTFTFKNKQVCFVAVVTYSNVAPEAPKPTAILSWQMGAGGDEATKVNSITGAAGCAAEGWTIAMTGDKSKDWSGGSRLTYKGVSYKSLKNSNGIEITVTLPQDLYATDVVFLAVTNDNDSVGSLKEFDGESVRDTVFSLKDYTNPTRIEKHLATPKNEFTFLFGGKQVCFIAAVMYTDKPENPNEPGESGMKETVAAQKAMKVIENGQVVIYKNGVRYNALGIQM